MSASPSPAIVLFAHGARDPDWARPFAAIKDHIEARLPGVSVALAFLDLMTPPLEAAIEALVADGAQHVTVVPVFMAQGGHVKRDVPLILDALRARYPAVTIALTPPVGESDVVVDAIARWVIDFVQAHAR